MTKIVCISDTHTLHRRIKIPDGDILICAGDITDRGELTTVVDFNNWLGELPHKYKIIIAGNHDLTFERNYPTHLFTNAIYLQDEEYITYNDLKIYGSPWQPRFYNWAFNLDRGAPIKEKWDRIPSDTDILITHGPPMGILDSTIYQGVQNENIGCQDLLNRINQLKLKLHVFGHIHYSYGISHHHGTTFVNASVCNEQYNPINKPIVVEV